MLVEEFTSTIRTADIHRIALVSPILENALFDDEDEVFEFRWIDEEADDQVEILIPRENIVNAYFDANGAILVTDMAGDEVRIECFYLVPVIEPAPASASDANYYMPAVARLAYEMATSSNLAFESGTEYDNDLYSGFVVFKNVAEDDLKGYTLPDEISRWPENGNLTNGELLQRIETHATEIQRLLLTLLSMVKDGLVQASEHDNLPLDMTRLDLERIATKGRQHRDNESLLADLRELVDVTQDHRRVLTDNQTARLQEIVTLLNERDVEIPFKVGV